MCVCAATMRQFAAGEICELNECDDSSTVRRMTFDKCDVIVTFSLKLNSVQIVGFILNVGFFFKFLESQNNTRRKTEYSKKFHAKFNGTIFGSYETDEYGNGKGARPNAHWKISVIHFF